MTQLNTVPNLPRLLLNILEESHTYKGSPVTIITVFHDVRESTAIIEDEHGNIFEVPRTALR